MQLKLVEGLQRVGDELVYVEKMTKDTFFVTIVKKVLYSKRSKYQLIEVVETETFGKMLYLNCKLQASTADEWIYHEALVHPALLIHPNPRTIVVIGGGDGGALREILKHPTVSKVTLVELDPEVVDSVIKYIPEIPQDAFKNERVEAVFMDGRKFIEVTQKKFDIIIADVTDPWGESSFLYTKEFYELVASRLNNNGLFVTQSLSINMYFKQFAKIFNAVSKAFKFACAYSVFVPSFSDEWAFIIGSNDIDPLTIHSDQIKKRYYERKLQTRFYDPEQHEKLLTLPLHIKRRLSEVYEVSTDKSPVTIPY